MTQQTTTPTMRQQIAAALPDHTHHKPLPFGWRSTWSTQAGVWSITNNMGAITIEGPDTTITIRRPAVTAAYLLGILDATGALPDRPATPTGQQPDTPDDLLPGCPAEVWDGPYLYRCGLGKDRCATHGPFEPARRCTTTPGCRRPDSHGGRCDTTGRKP